MRPLHLRVEHRRIGHLLRGLRLGYPPCCVLHFTLHSLLNLPGAQGKRGSRLLGIRTDRTVARYVPCWWCQRVGGG